MKNKKRNKSWTLIQDYHHLDENEIIDNFPTCNGTESVKSKKLERVKLD